MRRRRCRRRNGEIDRGAAQQRGIGTQAQCRRRGGQRLFADLGADVAAHCVHHQVGDAGALSRPRVAREAAAERGQRRFALAAHAQQQAVVVPCPRVVRGDEQGPIVGLLRLLEPPRVAQREREVGPARAVLGQPFGNRAEDPQPVPEVAFAHDGIGQRDDLRLVRCERAQKRGRA